MIKDAEMFAEEDAKVAARATAKVKMTLMIPYLILVIQNELEQYAYGLKNQVGNDDPEKGLGSKLSDEDKEEINTAVENTIEWLDENGEVRSTVIVSLAHLNIQTAEAEDIKEMKEKLEGIVKPIIDALYADQGGADEDHDEL